MYAMDVKPNEKRYAPMPKNLVRLAMYANMVIPRKMRKVVKVWGLERIAHMKDTVRMRVNAASN